MGNQRSFASYYIQIFFFKIASYICCWVGGYCTNTQNRHVIPLMSQTPLVFCCFPAALQVAIIHICSLWHLDRQDFFFWIGLPDEGTRERGGGGQWEGKERGVVSK